MPSPYLTPYAPSETYDYGPSLRIADLMGSMGRTRAEAFLRRGDIWGNALSQLGQLPLQIEQSRALSEQRKAIAEERRARTAAAQRQEEDRVGAVAAAQRSRQIATEAIRRGVRPDNTIDMDAVTGFLAQSGADPELFQEISKGLGGLAETASKLRQSKLDHAALLAHQAKRLGPDWMREAYALGKSTGLENEVDQIMPQLQEALSKGGVEGYNAHLDSVIALGSPELLQKLENLNKVQFAAPGSAIVKGGEVVGTVPVPEKDPTTLDAALLEAQRKGDPAQVQSLMGLAGQKARATHVTDPNAAITRENSRLDRSYQFNSTQLESARKPLVDQAERFNRLVETVNQRTPQADALIAPELLTVMAGGAGSGLRMNEAEIARLVGGRSQLESLKAAANKWQLDPSKALTVTDAQREQIRKLLSAMSRHINERVEMINKASEDLVAADSVEEHRKILSGLRAKLTAPKEKENDPLGIR